MQGSKSDLFEKTGLDKDRTYVTVVLLEPEKCLPHANTFFYVYGIYVCGLYR